MNTKMCRITANIFGVTINSERYDQLLARVIDSARHNTKPCLVFTPNPAFVLQAQKDPAFQTLLNKADINLPDGFGLVLFSRLMGWGLTKRVAGSDMVADLLETGNREGWRIGLVGLRGGVVSEAGEQMTRLKRKYSGIAFVDLSDELVDRGYFQLILACHGMVGQENWIWKNKESYRAGVMMGIGGSLDFITGYVKRAPLWVQKVGCEWLWRVGQKPSHYKRAIESIFGFTWLVVRKQLGIL